MPITLAPTSSLASRLIARPKMTRAQCVTAGIAICEAAERMGTNNQGPQGDIARHAGRGACIYAMDNIWYDGMSCAARESFGFNKDAFYKECGWPD